MAAIDDEDFQEIKTEVESAPIEGVDDTFRIMLISLKRILYEDIIFEDDNNDSDKSQSNDRTDIILLLLGHVYEIISGKREISEAFDGIRPLLIKLRESYMHNRERAGRAYDDYIYNSLKVYPYYMRDIVTHEGGSIMDIDG